ncbi:GNAT family N-acetyltransferase [Altererythrobacter sp. Z27]|uniref:GNAT family N-acetyltransferase n=1 Tax=Altererythrobacter sp. Z27 TaxID=3461147 RepID=UPI004044E9B0
MDRQPVLEGERLLLRPLASDDRDALFRVASDPLLWEQHPIGDRWQPDVFRSFFDEGLNSGGALVVTDRASGRIIGSSQFRPDSIDPDAVEIGWTYLAREYWGGAFNRELKRLMLAHALASVPRVLFRVGSANWRSRKAMEKIGGMLTDRVEHVEYKGRPVQHVVYEITRESFARGPLAG